MLDYTLTEEQEMIRDLARSFAKREILPVAELYDRNDEYPWPIVKKAQKLGLISSNVPERYGGPGFGVLEECIINEELAWACSGIQTALMLNNVTAWPIILAGTEHQKERYLPRLAQGGELGAYALTEPAAGSDVAGLLTRAVKQGDEYLLNGTKTWITNAPVASFFIIFAKTDIEARHRGISAFIVDRNWPGVTLSKPMKKMGQHAAWTGEIVMEDVRVPAGNRLGNEGDGFAIAMKVFDRSRPPVAAAAVGVARRALDEATRYAMERKAFGKPIVAHQGIGFMLADMATSIEAAGHLVRHSAWLVDRGLPNVKEAAMAKVFAADACMNVTTDAVQIFGGYGVSAEYPVEKLMRDAKIYQLYEGTSQIQRVIITRELTRR